MGLRFLNRKKETDHDRVREQLSEYLDRRLSPEERAAVELHLSDCQPCSDELRALQATTQLLHSLPSVRLPRSFLLEAAPRPAPLPRAFFWMRTAAAVAATAFVVLIAAPMVMPSGRAPASAPALYQPMKAASDARAGDQATASQATAPAAAARGAEPAAAAQERAAAPASAPAPAAALSAPAATVVAPAAPAAPGAAVGGAPAAEEPRKLTVPARAPSETVAQPARPAAAGPAPTELSNETGGSAPSLLSLLQTASGGLALLMATATAGLWWSHRRRNR